MKVKWFRLIRLVAAWWHYWGASDK